MKRHHYPKQIYESCNFADYSTLKPTYCTNKSYKKNGFCKDHQENRNTLPSFLDKERHYVVDKVRTMLDISDGATRDEKIVMCRTLFDFLLEHPKFLIIYDKFYRTVLAKLEELVEEYNIRPFDINIFDPHKYKTLITSVTMPKAPKLQPQSPIKEITEPIVLDI